MATNITLPADACAVSSFSEAREKASALGINITTLAEQCPLLCDAAYGNGNPDLSGVGVRSVNASYMTLVALAVLFALLRVYFIWSSKSGQWAERFQAAQQTFTDMAGVFSASVGIAIVISNPRQLSLYESIYMGGLCLMIWAATVLTILVCLFRSKFGDITPKILVMNFLYFWGITAILLVAFRGGVPSDYLVAAQQFSSSCKAYKDTGLAIKTSRPASHFAAIGLYFLSTAMTFIFFRVGFMRYRSTSINQPWGKTFKILITVFLCVSSGLVLGLAADFQLKRTAMKRVAGTRFQDDKWGFGQVIALFVWVPLLPALWLEQKTKVDTAPSSQEIPHSC